VNDFVNPKKRSIQLPKGYKDLADVLKKKLPQAGKDLPPTIGQCEYCGAPANAGSSSSAMYVPGELRKWDSTGWCMECARDVTEFHARAENKLEFPDDLDFADAKAMAALEQRIMELEEREKEYLRQKVAQRKGPDH
jgi:hypothetical protein